MRKMLIVGLIGLLSVFLAYGFASAVVNGACANCHTMHNSQNGAPMNWDDSSTPNATLLKGSCWGCHAYALINSTGNNIEFSNTTPQVAHTNATDLAGGNFAYVTGGKTLDSTDSGVTTDNCGHNVIETGNQEGIRAMFPPPGDEYSQAGILATTFTCAGTLGCHGNRTIAGSMAAISGSHHAGDSVLKFGASLDDTAQGGTTALSYRFLKGVKGAEDSDWQATVLVGDHNEYKGSTVGGTGEGGASVSSPGTAGSISGLCAECHGNFHGAVGDIGGPPGSPWLRHPTDIQLPSTATKEYQYYNACAGGGAACTYSLDAPVARANTINNANYPTAKNTCTPGTDDAIVMCLSCHKAHASKNADILRWNYEDINAGGGASNTRCFICHTTKDTGS